VLLASRLATLFAVGSAIFVMTMVVLGGAITGPTIGWEGYGLAIRLDALSATLFLLVAFIGAVVVEFSRNYLDGDGRQGAFVGGLCVTVASVMLLVLSDNLVLLVAAWIATSITLDRLLVFYPERRKALLAARKKFFAARVGDALLITAAVLLVVAFGTADIGAILEAARAAGASGSIPAEATGAAVFIAFAALLKSAQFPAHGWLPEVMETPTPVSALLHAGIINAGGFLVIRFADVMVLSFSSLHILALVGGFTALFGAVVMMTQPAIKTQLAWSTVAQMGFMILQCGLGAFALAALHLVAHSLYKAHAFLSSGSAVEKRRYVGHAVEEASAPKFLLAVVVALALYAGIGWVASVTVGQPPAVIALGAIVVMGLALLIKAGGVKGDNRIFARVILGAVGVSFAYVVLQAGAVALFGPVVPPVPALGPGSLAIVILVIASFAAVTVFQIFANGVAGHSLARAAYVHLSNGLYANALFDRLVDAGRRPSSTH
jgi:NAD(P)H-quinone oxidoreductase subunit 5